MAIVLPLSVSVGAHAAAGRDVEVEVPCCPDRASSMGRRSGDWRFVREAATCFRVFVARARCSSCARTHALVPAFCVLKRLNAAEVIGTVIETIGAGLCGARPAAAAAGVPHLRIGSISVWLWPASQPWSPTSLEPGQGVSS